MLKKSLIFSAYLCSMLLHSASENAVLLERAAAKEASWLYSCTSG